jgi:hypothetical protein
VVDAGHPGDVRATGRILGSDVIRRWPLEADRRPVGGREGMPRPQAGSAARPPTRARAGAWIRIHLNRNGAKLLGSALTVALSLDPSSSR